MQLNTLNLFSFSEKIKVLAGIFFRKFFGENTSTGKLLGAKSIADRIIRMGGSVKNVGDMYRVHMPLNYADGNKVSAHLRKYSTDNVIFKEILLQGGGDYLYIPVLAKHLGIEIKTIIDAGANIGCATLYFKTLYRDAKVVCIEPAPDNFEILEANISINNYTGVNLCKNAFWYNNDMLNIGIGVRGTREKELSYGVVEGGNAITLVKGMTFDDCTKMLGTDIVDVFKIDIEGAEAHIINNSEVLSDILNRTRILAIELHQEAVDMLDFIKLIELHGCKHMQKGEITYCWKENDRNY